MSILNPYILENDLVEISGADLPFHVLKDSTVLISGAAGFLPAYMVETFLYLNEKKFLNISVIGMVRNLTKARARFKKHESNNLLSLVEHDVSESAYPTFEKIDYIIHAASQASPVFYKTDPVGTLKANSLGTINLLELARIHKVKDFLFFSSGEIYGQVAADQIPIREETFGLVNPVDFRSCYAESKRLGETACVSYSTQYAFSTKIVRPFHTYGPGMSLTDGRVFSDFVSNIVNNQNIVLKSDGKAIRPYCYLSDAIIGFFTILLKGKSGEAYNIGNPEAEVSVRELAERLLTLYPEKNLRLDHQTRDKNDPYVESPIQRNCPDITKARALGWTPKHSIESGFKKTIENFL